MSTSSALGELDLFHSLSRPPPSSQKIGDETKANKDRKRKEKQTKSVEDIGRGPHTSQKMNGPLASGSFMSTHRPSIMRPPGTMTAS
jgi:hypothetical protein